MMRARESGEMGIWCILRRHDLATALVLVCRLCWLASCVGVGCAPGVQYKTDLIVCL